MPFKRNTTFTFKTTDQLEKERTQKLREQDTDGDGLNDYDELYVFRTSPFLEDSDSDGIPDGVEVAQESDPNCPKGKTCRQAKIFASSQTTGGTDGSTSTGGTSGTNPATGQAGTPTTTSSGGATAEAKVMEVIAETFGDPSKLTPQMITDGLEKMSPTQLREFLGKLGVPATALQRADDATLRKLVQDTLNEIAVSPPPASTSVNAPAEQPPGG